MLKKCDFRKILRAFIPGMLIQILDKSAAAVQKYSRMVIGTRANGTATKRLAKVSSGTKMATSTRATGKTERQRATVCTKHKAEAATSETGTMICNMDMEKKPGPTDHTTKDSITKDPSKEKVSINTLMDPFTRETGTKTKYKV